MTPAEATRLRWRAVETACTPQAAIGHGQAARGLFMRLRGMPAARRERLAAIAAPQWLAVLGPADALPWQDGVRYAAPHPLAPALWLPTHAEPDAPIDLLCQSLERRHGRMPLLLWPDPAIVLPLDRPLTVSDDLLLAISAAWEAGR